MLVFEDLCASDYAEKQRVLPIMKQRHAAGDKVRFTKGKLFINGSAYVG